MQGYFPPSSVGIFNKSGSAVFLLTTILARSSQKCSWRAGGCTGSEAVAEDVRLGPAWWLMVLFCPYSPVAWPLKGKQGSGITKAGVFWVSDEASQCYCLKSNKLQNFSDWKGHATLFSQLRKDVKCSG